MAFSAVFPRVLRPPFGPGLAAAAATADWWEVAGKTCVAAYQAIGAASLAASYVNLANPGTYDAAPGVAPSWASSTGWEFNGADQFLQTDITPAVDQSWSLFCRWSNASAAYKIAVGNNINADFRCGLGSGPFNAGWFLNGKTLLRAAGATPAGVYGVTVDAFLDGTDVGDLSGSITGSSDQIYIGGAYVNEFAASNHWSGYIQALVIYSDTLTAGEVATVSAAMAAL